MYHCFNRKTTHSIYVFYHFYLELVLVKYFTDVANIIITAATINWRSNITATLPQVPTTWQPYDSCSAVPRWTTVKFYHIFLKIVHFLAKPSSLFCAPQTLWGTEYALPFLHFYRNTHKERQRSRYYPDVQCALSLQACSHHSETPPSPPDYVLHHYTPNPH